MAVLNILNLIGRGYKIGSEYFQEEELLKNKEYILVGAGILQRGYCDRNLSCPEGYDKWFDTIEECEEYISSIEEYGYGNTISGPYPLFKEVKEIKEEMRIKDKIKEKILEKLEENGGVNSFINSSNQQYITVGVWECDDQFPMENPFASIGTKEFYKKLNLICEALAYDVSQTRMNVFTIWVDTLVIKNIRV